jgi:membrane protease YdiL (CAAX protease family)
MSTLGDTPLQIALSLVQLAALAVGALLLLRLLMSASMQTAVLRTNRLTPWPIEGYELALLLVLIFLLAMIGQTAVAFLFGAAIKASPDREGLEVAAYGVGVHGTALLGWPVFALLRRHLYADYGAEPPEPVVEPGPRAPWPRAVRNGVAALLVTLPLLTVVVLAWNPLLHVLGLPVDPQELIGKFGQAKSPVILTTMIVVACVLVPINEELVFRRGIYRFLRQRFGRATGLAVSALCFGALHFNWYSFPPLAAFGAVLAIAYEASGDIRVPIVAHALFNLNAILSILSGLPQ